MMCLVKLSLTQLAAEESEGICRIKCYSVKYMWATLIFCIFNSQEENNRRGDTSFPNSNNWVTYSFCLTGAKDSPYNNNVTEHIQYLHWKRFPLLLLLNKDEERISPTEQRSLTVSQLRTCWWWFAHPITVASLKKILLTSPSPSPFS